MNEWIVWEEEYPEDGCVVIVAWTTKGAARKWRKMTNTRGPVSAHPPLGFSSAEVTT